MENVIDENGTRCEKSVDAERPPARITLTAGAPRVGSVHRRHLPLDRVSFGRLASQRLCLPSGQRLAGDEFAVERRVLDKVSQDEVASAARERRLLALLAAGRRGAEFLGVEPFGQPLEEGFERPEIPELLRVARGVGGQP